MIYLLEDDDSIRKLVLYGLDSQGFQAKGCDQAAAHHHADREKFGV